MTLAEGEPLSEHVADCVGDPDGVDDSVRVPLPEGVTVLVDDAVRVPVGVPLPEGVRVPEGDSVADPVDEGVTSALRVPLLDAVAVLEGVALGVGAELSEPLCDRLNVELRVIVREGVREREAVRVWLCEGDPVGVGVIVCDCDELPDGLGVGTEDGLCVVVPEELVVCEALSVTEGVPLGVGVGEGDAVAVDDSVCVGLGVDVAEPVREALGL